MEKISLVYTSIDKEFINKDINIGEYSLDKIRELKDNRYNELFHSSSESWNNFWEKSEINIESSDEFDNFAVNFSLYHMQIMTPFHDNRFSIGAKGLTGEGYKGHVFWDTEIFMLPFFLYINPETAKQLFDEGALFVDGRLPEEFSNGHIKGAININYITFKGLTIPERQELLKDISKDKLIVSYCGSDSCEISIDNGYEIAKAGYDYVKIYLGGYKDWKNLEYPIEK